MNHPRINSQIIYVERASTEATADAIFRHFEGMYVDPHGEPVIPNGFILQGTHESGSTSVLQATVHRGTLRDWPKVRDSIIRQINETLAVCPEATFTITIFWDSV